MKKQVYDAKCFAPHKASAEDIERANNLPIMSCPRKYCWWWHSLKFDWHLTDAEGCTFPESETAASLKDQDIRCMRCDLQSIDDHYESRDPAEDGFHEDHWG